MIVIHIVNGRQPQNNGSLWPPGHKQLHTNVIIEISAGKWKTEKNFEREESANAFITHTPCVRNAKWQKMMKNLFANQPYQLWPYFPPPSMPSAYVGRLSPTIRRGKKGASMGRRANQTKHYSMPSMPSHCVRLLCPTTYIHIYIHTYIPLCLRFAFFGFIVSSRLRRFPPKMIDARHPLLWVYE